MKIEITLNVAVPREVMAILETLLQRTAMSKQDMDDLTREVAETKTVMGSAVALLRGLKAKLDDAIADPAKLRALSAELDTNANDLAAAVVENTPVDDGSGGETTPPVEPPAPGGTGTGPV